MAISTPDFQAYAMMTNDAIGLSMGPGQNEGLQAFMEAKEDNNGVFFSVLNPLGE